MFRIEVYDSDNLGNDKSLGWLELELTLLASGLRGKWFKLQVNTVCMVTNVIQKS
jgi:hypothetical protein